MKLSPDELIRETYDHEEDYQMQDQEMMCEEDVDKESHQDQSEFLKVSSVSVFVLHLPAKC